MPNTVQKKETQLLPLQVQPTQRLLLLTSAVMTRFTRALLRKISRLELQKRVMVALVEGSRGRGKKQKKLQKDLG